MTLIDHTKWDCEFCNRVFDSYQTAMDHELREHKKEATDADRRRKLAASRIVEWMKTQRNTKALVKQVVGSVMSEAVAWADGWVFIRQDEDLV